MIQKIGTDCFVLVVVVSHYILLIQGTSVIPILFAPGIDFIDDFSIDQGGKNGLGMIQVFTLIVHTVSIIITSALLQIIKR